MIRVILAASIALVTLGLAYRESYLGNASNVIARQQEENVKLLFDSGSNTDRQKAALAARQNLAIIRKQLRISPEAIDLYMLAAVNYRVLERPDDAIDMYTTALKYDRRPEIYLQLGNSEFERGNHDAALRAILPALKFNPLYIEAVTSASLRTTLSSPPYLQQWQRREPPSP